MDTSTLKEITGHKGYFVTENGLIWSNYSNKYIKATRMHSGYYRIKIAYPARKTHALHRLVAEAYIPNPENYTQVNHKDGDKSNNKVSNLEWCSASANVRHAWANGLCEHLRKRIVETKVKKVICVETGEIYNSAAEAGLAIGMRVTSIPTAIYKGHKCKGKTYAYIPMEAL